MAKKRFARRTYGIRDSAMLNKAQTLRDKFVKYLADFTAFSAHFDMAFADQWQQAIDDAIALLAQYPPHPELTVQRINKLNEVWDYANWVSTAAKRIYKSDPARRHVFKMTNRTAKVPVEVQ